MANTAASFPRTGFALRQFEVFQGLSQERLDEIARLGTWQSLPADAPLLSRDANAREVVFVVSGQARLTSYSAGGRQITLNDIGPGEFFGNLLSPHGGQGVQDAVALTSCVVARLDQALFMKLIREEPSLAERVVLKLVSVLHDLAERVVDLSTLRVPQRLQAELLRQARSTGAHGNEARLSPAPRHIDLANRIGTNREQVTRELNSLVRTGLLAKEGKSLVVKDMPRLARIVADVRGHA